MSSTNSQVRLTRPSRTTNTSRAGDGLLAPEAKDVDVLGSRRARRAACRQGRLMTCRGARLMHAARSKSSSAAASCHLGFELGDELAAVLPARKCSTRTDVLGVLLGRDAAGSTRRGHDPRGSRSTDAPLSAWASATTSVCSGWASSWRRDALPLGAGGAAHIGTTRARDVNRGAGGAGVRVGTKVARAGPVALARVLDGRVRRHPW